MNMHVEVLVQFIVEQYFINTRCLLIFTDHQHLNYIGNSQVVRISVENDTFDPDIPFNSFGCQGIIINCNDPASVFKNFEQEIKVREERFNIRKYILIPKNSKNPYSVFDTNELDYVLDLILLQQIDDSIFIWTNKYVGIDGGRENILLDKWYPDNQTFLYESNLYPDKLSNQMGRELRIATFSYKPYSIVGNNIQNSKGTELSGAIIFAHLYNMTPLLVVAAEGEWGTIYENWTGNGIQGNLAMDNADIGLGALYLWENSFRYLDFSKSEVISGVTCLVPGGSKLAAGWLTPIYSFSPEMWLATGVTFVTCIATLFYFNYFYSHTGYYKINRFSTQDLKQNLLFKSIFTITKLITSQALAKTELPLGIAGKYFISLLLIYELFLSSSYSSGLSTIMTIPRYVKSIDTVEEFGDSGLYWAGTGTGWIESIENIENPSYKNILERFKIWPEEKIGYFAKKKEIVIPVERLPHNNFAIISVLKVDDVKGYHLMKEDLYRGICIFMLRKNSILLPLFDKFVLAAFESGLFIYWQKEAIQLYMDTEVQEVINFYSKRHVTHNVVKLKWIHVEGSFAILCFGYVVSFMIFSAEITYYYWNKNKIRYPH